MTGKIERLQKEKMQQVQLLAVYYQVVNRLPRGDRRDQIIREILVSKNKIKQINQQLLAFNCNNRVL
ncbi:hypothetical protein IW492_16420 [Enterococcus sp. BWB1-3]|uniref:hypothetical protein n=1 Tax=unclassified Enterococcus TaxID=2608891 RepID=UPI00192307C9|nr:MULTISPECIES: hypothetical protein [unclassified Enterococcus]MBL1230814.1 hypothetical protein [Enterococcus sp. BWB1-3]MCB5950638.1 hypothetical protein [Enterococcus sp. BWT-B8]